MKRRLLPDLYRAALWILPPAFRRAWGGAMTREARSAWREARARRRRIRTVAVLAWDLARTAGREWWDVVGGRPGWAAPAAGGAWWDGFFQDLRYALRHLGRAPFLSAVTILVLTVGIGTNAVVFSVLEGILFRPPPGVGSTEGLVEVWSIPASGRRSISALSYPEFLAYREQRSVFGEVAAYRRAQVALQTGEVSAMVSAELASSGYFAVLDLRMELGTGFSPGDDRSAGGAAHAVLGHAHWQRSMGGSPDVVGRTIEVNGRPFTVVGVAPERFYGAGDRDDPVDLWLPAAHHALLFPEEEDLLAGDRRAFGAVARLVDGVTPARARAVAQATWGGLAGRAGEVAAEGGRRIEVGPYRGIGSRRMEDALAFVGVVGGIVGSLVLLIACVNAGGLLLGRALGRRREIGVRLALGAGRRRIVRQLLTESVLLASVAGAAGVLITFGALGALERALFTFPVDLAPSGAVLASVLGVTAVTGLAFGLVPALHATRASVHTAIRDDVAGVGRRSSRMRDTFAVGQLALSLPLLTGAGLLVGQLESQVGSDYGFADPESVLSVRIDLRRAGYGAAEVGPLLSGIRERVAGMPGVRSTAFSSAAPFMGFNTSAVVRLPSSAEHEPALAPTRLVRFAVVDPGYFATMGIPILAGRGVDPSDGPGAPLVAVVDEDVARRAWPGEDPVGRSLTLGREGAGTSVTVVGVVGRVRMTSSPSEETLVVYGSRRQLPDTSSMTLLVRTSGDAGALVPLVRSEIAAVDRDLVVNASVLADRLRAGRTELAHASAGATACGLIALLLACVGLYGTVATGVTARTGEIGVRIALGADRSRVIRHFVGRGLSVTLVALGIGLPLSWVMIPVVGTGVVGVGAFAPEVAFGLGGVTILLLAVALVSSWLPARRAGSVDPVRALSAD